MRACVTFEERRQGILCKHLFVAAAPYIITSVYHVLSRVISLPSHALLFSRVIFTRALDLPLGRPLARRPDPLSHIIPTSHTRPPNHSAVVALAINPHQWPPPLARGS